MPASTDVWHRIKHTFGVKRLFWRIFIVFWLASILVMIATSFVLVNNYSSDEYNKRFNNTFTRQAERIVWRYEQEFAGSASSNKNLKKWIEDRSNRNAPLVPILIKDKLGNTVYRYRMNKTRSKDLIELQISGPSNQIYYAQTRRPEAPRIYKQVMYRFQSLQFVFIFIAAALVSALLSWSIVLPLNSIGAFSRRYANEQNVTSLPEKLLRRGDELGDLAVDIDFMVNKTHRAANAQQQLLHDVSHELRAPLARLQVSTALIEQKDPESRHVKQIHNDCARIDQLIQQILDYSKLEQDNPRTEVCDLNALCEHVIDNMAVNYPHIPVTFNPIDKAQISGFPEALLQALDNIIGNACKYSQDGQFVEVSTLTGADKVIVAVRDHGPGVDKDEIAKLLQPFYRAGNQMHTSGFGLGLSIALKAVKKHHGELQMTSPDDGGLYVELIFPLKRA